MTQDRRKDENRPTEALVFTDAALTAAALAHLEAEKAAACLVHAKDDVWVGVGTKDALRGLLREDASQSQAVPSELASQLGYLLEYIENEAVRTEAKRKFAELVAGVLSHSAATGMVPGNLAADDVEWIVNDNAELGVKIGNQFFFLYKGGSLVYESGCHDNGEPMMYRRVFKREFGECAHPINYDDFSKIGTVSLGDSDEWKPIAASPAAPLAGKAPEKLTRSMCGTRDYCQGWNDCVDQFTAPLAAAVPAEEASDERMSDKLRDWLEGMSVSMDVSTGEHDAEHRYFGKISEVMDYAGDKHGVTLLVYEAKPNFEVAPAEPAPIQASALTDEQLRETDGYKLGWMEGMQEGAELATGGEKTAADVEAEFADLLPGSYYMDLPDGGSPTVLEQISRMAEDAAQWRAHLARLSKPTAQGTAPSIDTPEFSVVLAALFDANDQLEAAEGHEVFDATDKFTAARSDLVEFINRHIAAQAPADRDAQQWISVDERLPEDNQTVAILYWPYNNRENSQVAGAAEYVDGAFYTHEGDMHHYPSHWAPIPALLSQPAASHGAVEGEQNEGGEHA